MLTPVIDVILRLAGELTVKGATGSIIEYFGPGVDSLSCTGMATICNMGAETGATTSMFPYTNSMGDYLTATNRGYIRESIEQHHDMLSADHGAEYDQVIHIDLSQLEPHINGPLTPDLSTPNSDFKKVVAASDWPADLSAGLIGSCTNSSYEDMNRVASLTQQALGAGLKPKIPFLISVGSEQTRAILEKEGILGVFEESGGVLLANACGPCCGSWAREDVEKVFPHQESDISTNVFQGHSKFDHHILQSELYRPSRLQSGNSHFPCLSRNGCG
jgi:aconitate hydratase